jgi:DNA-binding NtrC family response regulator
MWQGRSGTAIKVLWITADDERRVPSDGAEEYERASASQALIRLRTDPLDAILLETPAMGWEARELILELRAIDATVPIVVRDVQCDLAQAVEWTQAGAFHVISLDAALNALSAAIHAGIECMAKEEDGELWRRNLIGNSPPMRQLVEFIRLVGPRRCTVLISGETGTGKELVARALHDSSPRASMPRVSVNCAALPEHLLEAELFGHVRGAFTGAMNSRAGRFEQAHRGTLFLDEIADIPFELQAKLLRVLQERELQRLGSSETVAVDVRVIAASNVDLLERVRDGRFREDLYYRLSVVPVNVAPLRDRPEDIPALIRHFIRRVAEQEGLAPKYPTRDTLEHLTSYDWPGNVRQLENVIEMAMILSGERELLIPSDFPLPGATPKRLVNASSPLVSVPDHGLDFERTVGQIELSILEQALRKTNGNKKQAADMLRLKRTTLAAKLKTLEALAI